MTRFFGRKWTVTVLGAGVLALALPSPAAIAQSTAPQADDSRVTVDRAGVIALTWNCDQLSESDRARALREGLTMCGLNETPGRLRTMAASNNNCGTAYIYTSQAGGRARVDYSLHSTAGIITGRNLDISWGPSYSGGKKDLGPWWGTGFYGNKTDIGFAMKGKKFGASMSGWVSLAGWTITCGVYVREDPRTL